MMFQIVIEVDSDLDVLAVDGSENYIVGNDIVGELATMKTEWAEMPCPDGGQMMPGTRVHGNRKAVHAIVDVPGGDPLTLVEGVIEGYGLNWTVLGMYSPGLHLVLDTNGDPVQPIEYAIVVERELDSTFEVLLADEPDGSRPSLPKQAHQYAGWLPVIMI